MKVQWKIHQRNCHLPVYTNYSISKENNVVIQSKNPFTYLMVLTVLKLYLWLYINNTHIWLLIFYVSNIFFAVALMKQSIDPKHYIQIYRFICNYLLHWKLRQPPRLLICCLFIPVVWNSIRVYLLWIQFFVELMTKFVFVIDYPRDD